MVSQRWSGPSCCSFNATSQKRAGKCSTCGQRESRSQQTQLDGKLMTDWNEVWPLRGQMLRLCAGALTRMAGRGGQCRIRMDTKASSEPDTWFFLFCFVFQRFKYNKPTLAGPGSPDNLSALLHINAKRNRKSVCGRLCALLKYKQDHIRKRKKTQTWTKAV